MHSDHEERIYGGKQTKICPSIHQILRSADKIMYFFHTIFTSFSSLIFEGVSDGKTFICTLLFVGCNLSTAQTRKKARYVFNI